MNKIILSGLFLFLSFLLTSCEKYFAEEEEEITQTSMGKLHITPRSADNVTIPYPINIYAFKTDDSCAEQKLIESETKDSISLSLPQGNYRIIVLAGVTKAAYNIPEQPTYKSVIEIVEGYNAESPLMTGAVDVNLTKNTKANINLTYAVAQLSITLAEIPKEYTNVDIELASFHSQLRLNGEYSEGKHIRMSCVKSKEKEGVWFTNPFYCFTSSEENTVISIHLTKEKETTTHGYTYTGKIKAGTPFILKGTHSGSFTFEGNLIAQGWEDPITIEFGFGKEKEEENETNTPDNETEKDPTLNEEMAGTFSVTEIPKEEDIFLESGLVVTVTPNADGTEATLLLMGLKNATIDGKEEILAKHANTAVKQYKTKEITNWKIPTVNEADILKGKYTEKKFTSVNKILSGAQGSKLISEGNARYLCNEGKDSFKFEGGAISTAGQKRSYYLRPVSTVRVVKEK